MIKLNNPYPRCEGCGAAEWSEGYCSYCGLLDRLAIDKILPPEGCALVGTYKDGVLVNGYVYETGLAVHLPCRHNNRKGMMLRDGDYKVLEQWCTECSWRESKGYYDPIG